MTSERDRAPKDSSQKRIVKNGATKSSSESKSAAKQTEGTAPKATVAESTSDPDGEAPKKRPKKKKTGDKPNNVRKIRVDRMMSKAELARRANLSVLTIDRVEKGFGCRMSTKRKILDALGLTLADRVRVFGEEE